MDVNFKTNLTVNAVNVDLNEFAHGFVTNIVICAVSMLKGGEDVKSLFFTLENHKPNLVINGKTIPLSSFPRDALVGTITGMVSTLKGITHIESISITIKAN
jgi:hypothetical protein